jgi:hypothetical protein
MTPFELVCSRLRVARCSGSTATAHCPGPQHSRGDRNPSLSVTVAADGKVLLKCHAGCNAEEIVTRMGLEMRDLFPTNGRPSRDYDGACVGVRVGGRGAGAQAADDGDEAGARAAALRADQEDEPGADDETGRPYAEDAGRDPWDEDATAAPDAAKQTEQGAAQRARMPQDRRSPGGATGSAARRAVASPARSDGARQPVEGVTIAQLADRFGLSADFLRDVAGLREEHGTVLVPYRDEGAGELFAKRRKVLIGPGNYRMPRGQALTLYGLDRLAAARAKGAAVFVEGESDCWCLWAHGVHALGIPGASAVKVVMAEHVRSLRHAYVVREPDDAGSRFVAALAERLRAVGYDGEPLRIVEMPDGLKDPGELHADDPARFMARFRAACKSAQQETGSHQQRPFRSLAELLADPAALDPPQPVVPRLAWKGRVTLLVGREKDGKSTLAAYAAARVSDGGEFLEGPCVQGPALWVGLEEHDNDAATRFVRFKARPEAILMPGELLADPIAQVEEEASRSRPALIVLDTLAALVSGLVDDPSSSAQWTPIMLALTRLARKTDAAMLLIHHAKKSDGRYRDSSAIGAGVDVIIELQPGTKDPAVRLLKPKGRFHCPESAVRFLGDRFDLVSGELPLADRVRVFVEQHPGCSLRQVRQGVSGRGGDVDAVLAALEKAGLIVNRGSGKRRAYYPTASLT